MLVKRVGGILRVNGVIKERRIVGGTLFLGFARWV